MKTAKLIFTPNFSDEAYIVLEGYAELEGLSTIDWLVKHLTPIIDDAMDKLYEKHLGSDGIRTN